MKHHNLFFGQASFRVESKGRCRIGNCHISALKSAHLHIFKSAHHFVGLFLLVTLLFTSGCDPAYHLTYAVLNDTGTPIYCVDKSKRGATSVMRVEPDSAIIVYEEAGIGFAKTQFRESKPEVTRRFVYYTDSTLADSVQVVPAKGWKYYRLPIGYYNARIYIREKDLKK
jgi:hypothetical protein